MNHRDQQTLEQLLNQLWDTRKGQPGPIGHHAGWMTAQQLSLLAAAMRIVAGSDNGPNLPPPPDYVFKMGPGMATSTELATAIRAAVDEARAKRWAKHEPAQPGYIPLPNWRTRLTNWLARK